MYRTSYVPYIFYAAIAAGHIRTSSKIFVQTSSLWQLENSSQVDLQRWRDVQCCLQVSRQSGASLGHPGILPWCSLTHRHPCCPEDPLDILGSSLGVPSNTGPHAVRRIPWTSQNPLVSPQTQTPMLSEESLGNPGILHWSLLTHSLPILSGGSLVYPGILPWCPSNTGPHCCPEVPLDIPGSSLGVPSWDPPIVSPQIQAPMQSGGSL